MPAASGDKQVFRVKVLNLFDTIPLPGYITFFLLLFQSLCGEFFLLYPLCSGRSVPPLDQAFLSEWVASVKRDQRWQPCFHGKSEMVIDLQAPPQKQTILT